MTTIKAIQSEFVKLKYPPILWLIGFIIFVTLVIIFSAYYIDINNTITLGRNPWSRLNKASHSIFAIFISIPFVVLLLSAALFIENKNYGFKQLYTLPQKRSSLILYKVITLILSIFLSTLIMILGLILVGYLLNFIYPESEFSYFALPFFDMVQSFTYTIVSLLGIFGIQFFLSIKFEGFLVPASVGILSYIVGLIFGSINSSLAIYFPYAYPIIARENNIFRNTELVLDKFWIINEVELYSIIVFVLFIAISLLTEKFRNI